jgi:hypothetical protein
MKWEAIPQDVATLAKGSPLEDSASERVTCAICLNVMVEPVSLVPCGHTFDKKCIQEAMDNKPTGGFTCPKGCQHVSPNASVIRGGVDSAPSHSNPA